MNYGENPEDKLAILHERRSVRRFKPDRVPPDIVLSLIRHATSAPSSTNRQAWRFIIVTDPSLKRKIVEGGGSVLIDDAPCGILVMYDNTTRNTYYHDDFQSGAACIQNLLLAAQAYGLGACWVCTLPGRSFLRKLFAIPSCYSPIAYVLLGRPSGVPLKEVPRRNTLEEIVGENRFPRQKAAAGRPGGRLYLERLLIWIYRNSPVFLKKRLLNKVVDRGYTRKFEN